MGIISWIRYLDLIFTVWAIKRHADSTYIEGRLIPSYHAAMRDVCKGITHEALQVNKVSNLVLRNRMHCYLIKAQNEYTSWGMLMLEDLEKKS